MFKNAKVGEKVWYPPIGWGEIAIIENDDEYPLTVCFKNKTFIFTIDGKFDLTDKYPSLFYNEFEVPKEAYIKPLPKIEIDTPVWVWRQNKNNKQLRVFSHFGENSIVHCFRDGHTSKDNTDTIEWDNYELVCKDTK